MTDGSLALDRARVRHAFSQAAAGYDAAAVLQAEICQRLEARDPLFALQPERILDLGCGTGRGTALLGRRYPRASLISIDFALPMLEQLPSRQPWLRRLLSPPSRVCADAESLPLAADSVDLIFSSLMLQWCDDLDRVFAECRRVLRPGGLISFATFGPDTLTELRQAWAEVDGHTHVNGFIDMHDVGDALSRAGFDDPVMDAEHIRLTYSDVRSLMRDIKGVGAHNATRGRARGLTGPGALRAVEAAYERFRDAEGRLPLSYEVVYGHAWVGDGPTTGARDGEARLPVGNIGRMQR